MEQQQFACACGQTELYAKGRCARCYFAHRHDIQRFGGQREATIRRDGGRCRLCSSFEVVVHHRVKGDHGSLVTLCPHCHPRLLRYRLFFGAPPLFVQLWKEQHPGQAWQHELPFFAQSRAEQLAFAAAS